MTATAQEAFTETVRALPPSEQFRLAALILQELTQSEVVVLERSDTWSEQDQSDLTAALQYAAKLYPEEAAAAADTGRGSGGYFSGGAGDGGAVERETERLLAEIIGDGGE